MKRINGWRCQHCSDFSEDPKVIEAHEKECSLNPILKNCGTCEHRTEGYPFGGFECDVNQKGGFEYDEGEINCPKWKLKYSV